MSDQLDDDEILIEEDLDSQSLANISQRTWKIAIVDDDEDASDRRVFLTQCKDFEPSPRFIHTYSKAETQNGFAVESDIAVVLLDVVMETEHAGLDLVAFIRDGIEVA